jgi:two-component system sensor histidine kinase VicK
MDSSSVFEPLATHGPLVYFAYRPADRRILYVSPNYARELGGNIAAVNEELPGWLAALHPDDRRYLGQQLAVLRRTGELKSLALRYFRPGGGTRWLCLTATRHPANGTHDLLFCGHVQDITASRNVVENAYRYQAKKNSMLEILSHDLASPLVLAEQLAEYLAERVQGLHDPHLNAMIEEMRASCQSGVALIRDFVDQEFLDSASVDLKLERLDLAERLQLVLETYQRRQHHAGHSFAYHTTHPSIYADIDDNKFMQVVNNLLGNAMKFTPDGGQLRVELSQHPNHLLLTIADNGIGIPRALQGCLFDRFTAARRTGLRGEKTTGLGMSIIKTLVELHRGRIWFESEEGRGTTFFIRLPRPEAE